MPGRGPGELAQVVAEHLPAILAERPQIPTMDAAKLLLVVAKGKGLEVTPRAVQQAIWRFRRPLRGEPRRVVVETQLTRVFDQAIIALQACRNQVAMVEAANKRLESQVAQVRVALEVLSTGRNGNGQ